MKNLLIQGLLIIILIKRFNEKFKKAPKQFRNRYNSHLNGFDVFNRLKTNEILNLKLFKRSTENKTRIPTWYWQYNHFIYKRISILQRHKCVCVCVFKQVCTCECSNKCILLWHIFSFKIKINCTFYAISSLYIVSSTWCY